MQTPVDDDAEFVDTVTLAGNQRRLSLSVVNAVKLRFRVIRRAAEWRTDCRLSIVLTIIWYNTLLQ